MSILNVALLMTLSAIWGASFIFMRYLSNIFGAVITADLRLLIAGLFLVGLYAVIGVKIHWRKFWRYYLVIGVVNSGLPFLLYSYAALHIPASISVIINLMAPIFVAVFSVIWLNDRLNALKISGLLLGTAGVVLVASFGVIESSVPAVLSVFACVGAACCYGISGVLIKKRAMHIEPKLMAAGSQVLAGGVILPIIFLSPPRQNVTGNAVILLIVFALLCSAIAYLIYYRLVASIGPTKTLTVTFLMPVFGMIWSRIFLNEQLTGLMITGAFIILLGTLLVSFDKKIDDLFRRSPGKSLPDEKSDPRNR